MLHKIFLILSLLFVIHQASARCPQGWVMYNSNCYYFSDSPYTFNDSRAVCQKRGGDLPSLVDQAEWEFVKAQVKLRKKYFWIGATDEGDEANWRWVDGKPWDPALAKASWAKGQPDNWNDKEHCAMARTNGDWNDIGCTANLRYICKRPTEYIDRCDLEDGWHGFGDRCYKFFTDTATFSDAQDTCSGYDGNLLIVDTPDKLQILTDSVTCQEISSSLWIGLSDTNGFPGTYIWVDGSPITITNWDDGMPKNVDPGNTCVEVVAMAGFKWRTSACNVRKKFMCQKPPGKCLEGWQELNENCYKTYGLDRDINTWPEAQHTCHGQKAGLLKLESPQENAVIVEKVFPTLKDNEIESIWLGLSDRDIDGSFVWWDKNPVLIPNWGKNQPRNTAKAMDCGSMQTGDATGKWTTSYCFTKKAFVCEHPIWIAPDPKEPPTLCKKNTMGQDWNGELAKTRSGRTCQRWDSQEPHKHTRNNPANFPDADLATAANKCRNPDRTPYGPWCYTNDPKTRWEYCDIPFCHDIYRCEDGWEQYETSCFYFGDDRMRWSQARSQCQNMNADLATINTEDEQSFISKIVPWRGWIGLRDTIEQGKYYWVDGSPLNYTNWMRGEPNNYYPGEDCVEVHGPGEYPWGGGFYPGAWNDDVCEGRNKSFICRKPAIPYDPPPTTKPVTKPFSRRCGPEWKYDSVGNMCYQIVDKPSNWVTGRADCLAKGGELASIHGPHEQAYVGALLASSYGHGRLRFWFGGNDRDLEGGYAWSDGTPFNYVHWKPGNPSNSGGREHCVEIQANDGRWNDNNCAKKMPYICKKFAKGSTTLPPPVTPTAAPDCVADAMISGKHNIQDELLKASSIWDNEHGPWNSRLDFQRQTKCVWKLLIGIAINGQNDKVYDNVQLEQCKQYCTLDPACKSIEYWVGGSNRMRCSISKYNSDTAPPNLVHKNPAIDLYEKHCGDMRGSWVPHLSDHNAAQWIEADFILPMLVKGVITQGRQDEQQWVTKYRISWKYDNTYNFQWYEEPVGNAKLFDGNTDQQTKVSHTFKYPVTARRIRLHPTEWFNFIALRWEVMGCIAKECTSERLVTGPSIVPDESLTASSMWDALHSPAQGRLDTVRVGELRGAWVAGEPYHDQVQYIQADFGLNMRITGIITQGRDDLDQWVTSYKVYYSVDNANFHEYQSPYNNPVVFQGNSDRRTLVTNMLDSPFWARYVRVNPLTWNAHIAMRFDVLGCLSGCQPAALIDGPNPVDDHQLTAASVFDSNHGAHRSRLSAVRVGELRGAWSAKYNDKNQYIQVDLLTNIHIRAIGTKGRDDTLQWVTKYNLYYKLHGGVGDMQMYYEDGTPKVFEGNYENRQLRKQYLANPFSAQIIRLWALGWSGHISMRWEVYGCPDSSVTAPVGCFGDNPENRDLPYTPIFWPNGATARGCINHCFRNGYIFGGIQNGKRCFCGNSYGKHGPSSDCNILCPGDPEQNCGGVNANMVYGTGLAPTTLRCRDGYTAYGNNCYKVVVRPRVPWTDAQSACRNDEGDLATLNSEAENDFALGLIKSYHGGRVPFTWIGLSELRFENLYEWSDGQPVLFTKWNPGEPNDANKQEKCVHMYANSRWNDRKCESKLQYMCMTQKEEIAGPVTPDPSCPLGWKRYGNSCYAFMTTPRTWEQGKSACSGFGGTMVRIDDSSEQAFVASQLGLVEKGTLWTDLSDQASPGTYAWSNGNTFVALTHWAEGHPDDTKGQCVSMGTGQLAGLWYGTPCDKTNGVICEITCSDCVTPPTLTPDPGGLGPCAPGWIEFGSNCFEVNNERANLRAPWYDARQNCVLKGGDLASFHSEDEFKYVFKMGILEQNLGSLWIGLNNRATGQGHVWSDGSSVAYTNWNTNEPNNHGGKENCAEVYSGNGLWNDNDCNKGRHWICKIRKGQQVMSTTLPAIPSPGPPGSCSPDNDDWKSYNGKCYYVGKGGDDETLSWFAADQFCHDNGGYLASVHSDDDNNFIWGLVKDSAIDKYFIGLNELDQDKGYVWTDGTPGDYLNWAPNEPNDAGGSERCVSMYVRTAQWNDDHCTTERPFICMKKQGGGTFPPRTIPPPLPGNCPKMFKPFGNKCFMFVDPPKEGRLNATQARDQCRAYGANYDLASITNEREAAFVTSQMLGKTSDLFIGFVRRGKKFRWLDNSIVTYTNWFHGEPNFAGRKEYCVRVRRAQFAAGKWNDVPCEGTSGWICETYKQTSIPTPEPPAPSSCPTGFTSWNENCYMYVSSLRTWDQASSYCSQQSTSKLTGILSAYEQGFVYSVLLKNNPNQALWLGLSDRMVPGTYRWVTGWRLYFSNWGSNQPSRDNGGCVQMNPNGKWSDEDCNGQRSFICKISNDGGPPVEPPAGDGYCPDGTDDDKDWVKYNGFCYLFRQTLNKKFADAAHECNMKGAEMVSVHDQLEHNFIYTHLSHDARWALWIGLIRQRSGSWVWRDQSPVDFTKWNKGEPNDPDGKNNEDCTEMYAYYANGGWNNIPCTVQRGYICKVEQVSERTTITQPRTNPPPQSSTTRITYPPGVSTPSTTPRPGQTTKWIPPWLRTTVKTTTGGAGRWTTWGPFTWPTWSREPPTMGPSQIVATAPPPSVTTGTIVGIVIVVLIAIVVGIIAFKFLQNRRAKQTNLADAFDNPAYSVSEGSVNNMPKYGSDTTA
ncbi:unnamed protein product [Owenia fusiformis]|uniref:Macrophage mannose receptor 1 n=1 Tax=Owenia fusiformis TaxID=6347 RepID=A0A8S4PQZ8_OWEFU|nr:unnamed protein product [Owenia fusiformis]